MRLSDLLTCCCRWEQYFSQLTAIRECSLIPCITGEMCLHRIHSHKLEMNFSGAKCVYSKFDGLVKT